MIWYPQFNRVIHPAIKTINPVIPDLIQDPEKGVLESAGIANAFRADLVFISMP